jgi:hypothetical protein
LGAGVIWVRQNEKGQVKNFYSKRVKIFSFAPSNKKFRVRPFCRGGSFYSGQDRVPEGLKMNKSPCHFMDSFLVLFGANFEFLMQKRTGKSHVFNPGLFWEHFFYKSAFSG